MKVIPRFLVAKYVPDIRRLEPRNIGVIVWGDGHVACRFLGESTGKLRVPSLVEKDSRHAYSEWLQYWRYQLTRPSIRTDAGVEVQRDSTDFLTALKEKSKDFFRLVDGGSLMDRVPVSALDEIAVELFQKLVVVPKGANTVKSEAAELSSAFKRIIAETGISNREDYRVELPVPRRIHGVYRPFTVDAAIGPVGDPHAIFKKVLLSKSQSVDSSAFMFESLVNDTLRPIKRENCAAIVAASQTLNEEGRSGLAMLQQIVTVIDVNERGAKERIAQIALGVRIQDGPGLPPSARLQY